MNYNDTIYGNYEIQEPVILELINSPAMQRLKGIDQAWYFHVYFPGIPRSRFNHSLGVYLLLKNYWASIEEQIAWLLHDISHGTFSHCLDYVFEWWNQKEQSHQDNIFESFIKKTNIPDILKKHGLNIEYIIDDTHFPLKETTLPDLCADRIDYILRDAWHLGEFSHEEVTYILEHLIIRENKRIFKDLPSAKIFAELFYHMNEKYYAGIESAAMYRTVGDCLRYARKHEYLDSDDFYTVDTQVLDKITTHIENNQQLDIYWQRMNNKIPFTNNPNDFDAHVFCKSRIVDPLFVDDTIVKRVSDVDSAWKMSIQNALSAKEYFLKFEK